MNITPISLNFNKTKLNSNKQEHSIQNNNPNFGCDILELKPRKQNTEVENDFDTQIIEYDFVNKKPKTTGILDSLKNIFLKPFKINQKEENLAISKTIDKNCVKILESADKKYDKAEKEIKKFNSYLKLGKDNNWKIVEVKNILSPEVISFKKANKKDKLPTTIEVRDAEGFITREYEITDKNNFSAFICTNFSDYHEIEIQDGKPYSYIESTLDGSSETIYTFEDNDDFTYEEVNYDEDDFFDSCSVAFRINPKNIYKSEYVEYDEKNDSYNIYTPNRKTNTWKLSTSMFYYPYEYED